MEAVRPKKTKAKTSGKSQLVTKKKQAEEEKRAAAPSEVCDEASTSGFIDIPLSLPYQEPEEEQQDPVQPPETTAQPSDLPPDKQKISSSQTLSTSVLTKDLQSTVSLSPETSQGTEHLTESSKEIEEDDDTVAAQKAELQAAPHATELEKDTQSWNQPCVSSQFEIPNAPSAPALYPSLPALEEGPVIQLHEQAVKNSAKGPAVLALPEQESSPPSLQPLDSVAELSRSKLYPELPKTAPEIQVLS
ncbi:ectopic P granules protein 5 homolog [Lates japonicus]